MIHYYTILAVISIVAWSCQNPSQQSDNDGRKDKEPASLSKAVSNSEQIGGPCEGCEAVEEYGDRQLTWVDTLEDFHQTGPKISVAGTIYMPDGKTPAKDVILYLYHTDQTGVYPSRADLTGVGRRHGYLRTWLKTDASGRYEFYTLRPASYPGSTIEAHIHAIIKEPGKSPYWIDEFLFDDDPYLTKDVRTHIQGRGGFTGIMENEATRNGIAHYIRDITLGLNVY